LDPDETSFGGDARINVKGFSGLVPRIGIFVASFGRVAAFGQRMGLEMNGALQPPLPLAYTPCDPVTKSSGLQILSSDMCATCHFMEMVFSIVVYPPEFVAEFVVKYKSSFFGAIGRTRLLLISLCRNMTCPFTSGAVLGVIHLFVLKAMLRNVARLVKSGWQLRRLKQLLNALSMPVKQPTIASLLNRIFVLTYSILGLILVTGTQRKNP
jgi:hypothetical protein